MPSSWKNTPRALEQTLGVLGVSAPRCQLRPEAGNCRVQELRASGRRKAFHEREQLVGLVELVEVECGLKGERESLLYAVVRDADSLATGERGLGDS